MDIQIRKLVPDLLEDYLYFFENNFKECDCCYCLNFSRDANSDTNFSSSELRREYAINYVTNGMIQGYLAYEGKNVVGWCNVNHKSDCLECRGLRKLKDDISPDLKTKSVFCFAIVPDMRGKGIATALLDRVCEEAKNDGYECIEAYPFKTHDKHYIHRGPIELYEKFGFSLFEDMEQRAIVRKILK